MARKLGISWDLWIVTRWSRSAKRFMQKPSHKPFEKKERDSCNRSALSFWEISYLNKLSKDINESSALILNDSNFELLSERALSMLALSCHRRHCRGVSIQTQTRRYKQGFFLMPRAGMKHRGSAKRKSHSLFVFRGSLAKSLVGMMDTSRRTVKKSRMILDTVIDKE